MVETPFPSLPSLLTALTSFMLQAGSWEEVSVSAYAEQALKARSGLVGRRTGVAHGGARFTPSQEALGDLATTLPCGSELRVTAVTRISGDATVRGSESLYYARHESHA